MRRIHFVRHGRTDDNARGIFQGQTGRGLDAVGRDQVRRLAARLEGRSFAGFICSDLERAVETAEILVAAVKRRPAHDPAFREIDVGTWSGITAEEAARTHPEEHAAWRAGEDVRRGGGESYAEVAARVHASTLRWLHETREGDLLVVSHGTAIRCFAARVLGLPAQASRAWPVMANAATSAFGYEATFRLITWNDAAHLEVGSP